MGNENTPFSLNGFSYADAKIEFNGLELPGITSFNFKKTKGKRNNYGLGSNPVSRSKLHNEYEGSLDMDYDTQKILAVLSPTGLLTEVPAGIMILTLAKEDGGKEIVTVTTCEFENDGITGAQGDENLTESITIMFGTYNKVTF